MDYAVSWKNVETIIEQEIPGLPGWCTTEKAKRMAQISRGASLCVELGVFGGRGLAAMALALAYQGSGRADGIDPFTPAAALEGTNDPANDEWWSHLDYESIALAAQNGFCDLGLYQYTRLVRLRSTEVVSYYEDGSVDVLHQDSNHAEEVSCAEVGLWTPKIRAGGYWILDDADWASTQKAQQDLVARGFDEIENHVQWKVYRKQ